MLGPYQSALPVLSTIAAIGFLLAGCVGGAASEPAPAITGVVPDQHLEWSTVNDFLYQLQDEDLEEIGETAFDLLIISMEPVSDSPASIETLRHSPGGEKYVLCYVSIGQAEDYRFYWQEEWEQDPPAWLDRPDRDWPGDWWVRYWDPQWQSIVFGSPQSYVDRVLALGFDGVYLDRPDAYEYYAEQGRESAAAEMADFVIALASYVQERYPGRAVFVQNAEELGILFPEYVQAVTGVSVEDLHYGYPDDNRSSPPEWTAERERILDQWLAAGKLVLTVNYTSRASQIADAYLRARARGYIPYATDRDLDTLRINEGFEPD